MTELDQAWDVALAQATQRAQGEGRADLARYLDLRRRNDLLRRTATDWLLDAVFALAADANRQGNSIQRRTLIRATFGPPSSSTTSQISPNQGDDR